MVYGNAYMIAQSRIRMLRAMWCMFHFVRDRALADDDLGHVNNPLLVQQQNDNIPLLSSIPRLHKRPLCLVRIVFCTHLLNADLCTVFCKDDIFLLELVDAALGEFVRVEEDL
jgi:hypothetical protein